MLVVGLLFQWEFLDRPLRLRVALWDHVRDVRPSLLMLQYRELHHTWRLKRRLVTEVGELPLKLWLCLLENGRWHLRRWILLHEMRDGVLWLPVDEKALWLECLFRGLFKLLEFRRTFRDLFPFLTDWWVKFVMLPNRELWRLKYLPTPPRQDLFLPLQWQLRFLRFLPDVRYHLRMFLLW